MRVSDTPAGRGRAASDLAFLLLLAVVAVETQLVVSAGWMLRYGDWSGAMTVLLVGARDRLAMPIVVLLIGSVLLTLSAGWRRRPADDFDLTCVALTPLVVLELVHSLLLVLRVDLHVLIIYLGYAWFAGLLGVGFLQTRTRERRGAGA